MITVEVSWVEKRRKCLVVRGNQILEPDGKVIYVFSVPIGSHPKIEKQLLGPNFRQGVLLAVEGNGMIGGNELSISIA